MTTDLFEVEEVSGHTCRSCKATAALNSRRRSAIRSLEQAAEDLIRLDMHPRGDARTHEAFDAAVVKQTVKDC